MAKKMTIPIKKLVENAITQLNEKSGSSIRAITKFILSNNPDIDAKRLSVQMKRYVKKWVLDGKLTQVKRSFKLAPSAKKSKSDIKERLKRTTKNTKVAKDSKDFKAAKGSKASKEKIKNNMPQKDDEQPKTKQRNMETSTTEVTSNNASKKPRNQSQAVAKTSIKASKKNSNNNEKSNSKQFTEKRKLLRKSINLLTNPVPSRSKISGIKQPKAKQPDTASATKTVSKKRKKN